MIYYERPNREIDRVFLHCSASDNPEHDDISVIRDWHVRGNGWSDVGYHYYIRKDGGIQRGRGLERIPAAQKGDNTGTLAICLGGLEADKFTLAQYGALCNLCMQIDRAHRSLLTFHGHKEVANKECPVFDYKALLHLDPMGRLFGA